MKIEKFFENIFEQRNKDNQILVIIKRNNNLREKGINR